MYTHQLLTSLEVGDINFLFLTCNIQTKMIRVLRSQWCGLGSGHRWFLSLQKNLNSFVKTVSLFGALFEDGIFF